MKSMAFCVLCLWALLGLSLAARKLPDELKNDILANKDDVNLILNYILHGAGKHEAWNRMAEHTDKHGPRITGSQALIDSIDELQGQLTSEGFTQVNKEEFTAFNWIRGKDTATVLAPREIPMNILALGSSIATIEGGITEDAVVVRSFDELDALGAAQVAGKIVVYNQPWVDYGVTNEYRQRGAERAAMLGGVASLVRSVASFSLYTPHTGQQNYADGVTPIPSVSITEEDAELLQRFYDNGETISIHLDVKSHPNGTTTTHNLVSQITGSTLPAETVSFGGHIDSWDVGTGAMDDAGGVMISWQVLTTIKKLGLQPKRTMRTVFWSAEEPGLVGGDAYFAAHKANQGDMSLIMESDHGTFTPYGIGFSGSGLARAIMEEILEQFLTPYNITTVGDDGAESDTAVWVDAGVPGVKLLTHAEQYFHYHHTKADVASMQDPDDLDLCAALWTVVAYVVANLEDKLPLTGEYPVGPDPEPTGPPVLDPKPTTSAATTPLHVCYAILIACMTSASYLL